MKKPIVFVAALLLFCTTYGQGLQLFLGVRGGIGDMMTHDQLSNINTTQGSLKVVKNNNGWSSHFKGEALIGIGRLRIGYQFLYNFSSPSVGGYSVTPVVDNSRFTTYFNTSQNHFFGHYLLVELAVINGAHFALTPGIALGSFTGYKTDNTSGITVSLSETTHHRFSMGLELNAELKFAKRLTLFLSPNYYLFSLQDKANSDWHEYLHFIGVDLGLRINLLKVNK